MPPTTREAVDSPLVDDPGSWYESREEMEEGDKRKYKGEKEGMEGSKG